MGLMGEQTPVGRIFDRGDLDSACEQGHELACHTLDHLLCSEVEAAELVENCRANQDRAREIQGAQPLRNFSYPEGVVTLAAKRTLSSVYDSCRTIEPGFNLDPIDLGYLRANRIYSKPGIEMAKELVRQNEARKGWLIFYTHDVDETPSPYGCTPEEFAQVVETAVRSGAQILPVREALTRFSLPA
jgi:peptidoglycan/xylan/chitin deacetylase (PgdA/CDA1 family)